MATAQKMSYCKNCSKMTMHLHPSTTHVLHLLLSIITLGAWAFIWLFVTANNAWQGQCSTCGKRKGIFG